MKKALVLIVFAMITSVSFGGQVQDSVFFNDHYYFVVESSISELKEAKVLPKGTVSTVSFSNNVKSYFVAGMFPVDGRCMPLGLLYNNRQMISPLNLDKGVGNFYLQPNAIFSINKKGASIVESFRYKHSNKSGIAFQSGPMLLSNKVTHPQINYFSTNRTHRSAVGVTTKGGVSKVVFVKSIDKVSFYDIAQFLQLYYGCDDAILLESGITHLQVLQGSTILSTSLKSCWNYVVPIN